MKKCCIFFFFFCFSLGLSWAQSLDPKTLLPFLQDKKPLWIEANGQKYLVAYSPAQRQAQAKGVLILLHDSMGTLLQPQIILPLQNKESALGWDVYSVQIGDYAEEASQIKAQTAILDGLLKEIKLSPDLPCILFAYGRSAQLASVFAQNEKVKAVILIGADFFDDKQNDFQALLKKQKPVLDLIGTEDYARILAKGVERAKWGYGVSSYEQEKLLGQDHDYIAFENIIFPMINAYILKSAGLTNALISG